jgi:SAM-dependent methyltransferase
MSLYSEFAPWYEQLFPFREEVYLFLSEYAGTSGSTILDAGCGPGHYCARFQHDGSVAFYRCYPIISQECVIFDVELVSGGQKVFREQTTLYPLIADSFLQRHSDVGFSLTGMYAGFDKTPFNREHDSGLVMVIMKEQGSCLQPFPPFSLLKMNPTSVIYDD